MFRIILIFYLCIRQEIERERYIEIKPNMDIPPPPPQEAEIKLETTEIQVNFENKDSEYIFTGGKFIWKL